MTQPHTYRPYKPKPYLTAQHQISSTSTSTSHLPGTGPTPVMNFYRRSAVPSSSATTTSPNSVKDDFPEALTYRYNDNSAWVPAARTHEASFFSFWFFVVSILTIIWFFLPPAATLNFFWFFFYCCARAGGHRPRKTRLSRTAERAPRSHHLSHDGQVEHSMHYPGGMATRCAAASPVPCRGRENPGCGRIGGRR